MYFDEYLVKACGIGEFTVEAIVEHSVGTGSVPGLGEAEGFAVGASEAGSPDSVVKQG